MCKKQRPYFELKLVYDVVLIQIYSLLFSFKGLCNDVVIEIIVSKSDPRVKNSGQRSTRANGSNIIIDGF